jgi:mycothiol system anti-sigma-R factor
MKGCDDYSATIQLYLDRELSGQDLENFPPHLKECEACRTELEADERLSALLHRSRPLYSAPAALRARVMRAAESFPSTTTPPAVRLRKRGALAATLFLVTAGLLLLPGIMQRSRANSAHR